MAPFLTSEPKNHDHLFFGMASGEVFIYDIAVRQFTKYVIQTTDSFRPGVLNPDIIVDIKCHPEKMQKLLIAQRFQVCVYSLHK